MHVLRKALVGSTVFKGGVERNPFCMHTECCIAATKCRSKRGQTLCGQQMSVGIRLYNEGSRGGADDEMAVGGAYLS